jgi:hypothetical protein
VDHHDHPGRAQADARAPSWKISAEQQNARSRAFSISMKLKSELQIPGLTRFLDANRFPPADRVRGHASLENAPAAPPACPLRTYRQLEATRSAAHRRHPFRENQAGCSSALRTRSAVLRAPSLRMASAR